MLLKEHLEEYTKDQLLEQARSFEIKNVQDFVKLHSLTELWNASVRRKCLEAECHV